MDSTMPLGTLVEVTNPVTEEENADPVLFINLPDALSLYTAHYLTPHDFANLMLICKSVHHALRGGPGQFYLPTVLTRNLSKPFRPMIEHAYQGTSEDKGRLSNQSYRLVLTVQGESTEAKTYQQLLDLFKSGYAQALLTGQGESCLKKPQTKKEQQLNKAFKEAFASALSIRNINLKQTSSRLKKRHSLYYLHTLNALVKLIQYDDETEEANAKKIKALCYLRNNVIAIRKLYENPDSEKVERACIDTLHTKASVTRRRREYWAAFFLALALLIFAISICSAVFMMLSIPTFYFLGVSMLVWTLVFGFGSIFSLAPMAVGLIIRNLSREFFMSEQSPKRADAILPALHDWQDSQFEVIYDLEWSYRPVEHNLSFFSLKHEEPVADDRRLSLGL